MEPMYRIQNFEIIKILTDARRLEILQLLMDKPATLSQLGQVIGEHPAKIRHHLKQLENVGLIEMVDTRLVRGFVEKYYRAKARAFFFQEMILPKNTHMTSVPIAGSHDLALEELSHHLRQLGSHPIDLNILPIGSLDGLIALRQGNAYIAGCHLFDLESGEYNIPYVRHLLPDQAISLITLAHREQGLIIQKGNPKRIKSLQDLMRKDIRFINRNKGSGTRLWLDHQLIIHHLPMQEIRGYRYEVRTHTHIANAVYDGKADVGVGLLAAAQITGLDFIPLFHERFDLVLHNEQLKNKELAPMFDYINSAAFQKMTQRLGGYQTEHSGELITP
jgi:putative molybdopterin biosynthesis protein